MNKSKRTSPLLRWGRVLFFTAPLLVSCASDSGAQSSPPEKAAESDLVAAKSSGGDKDANKAADMKEVILHVFGMT